MTLSSSSTKCTNPRAHAGGPASVCKCPFSILTFNVYPGPPVPYTAPDLFPNRIAAQITALRDLQPDVVCLQELYCDASFAALRDAFPDYDVRRDPAGQTVARDANDDNDSHPRRRRRRCRCHSNNGIALAALCVTLTLSSSWWWWWHPAPLLHVAAAGALWFGVYLLLLPRHSGLRAWLSNRGTGLAIMVRRSRAVILDHAVERFQSQAGDPLNLVAPRGYQRTMLALESACECGMGLAIVFNTHLNALGSSSNRALQARQLAQEIRRVSVSARIVACGDFNEPPTLGGVRECLEGNAPHQANLTFADPAQQPTFCPQLNPLARGSTAQCLDHIYFKPDGLVLTDQVRLVFTNQPCVSDHYGVLATFH